MMLLTIFFFLVLCGFSNAHKILYLMPITTKSHIFVFEPLIRELAKRNHQVTIVSPIPFFNMKNVQEIILDRVEGLTPDIVSASIMSQIGIHVFNDFISFKYFAAPLCEKYLENKQVKELLKNGKQFDVVLIDAVLNECAIATAPLLGKNIILHSTTSLLPWMPSAAPFPLSYVPVSMVAQASKMNFFQRIDNIISFIGLRLIYDYDTIPFVQAVIAKHLPRNPLVSDGLNAIDFTITNADPVMMSPRPSLPNIAHVGGMHCRKAGSVPKEFEDFIQSSGDNGFILFSLGSVAQSQFLSKDVVQSLLKAFSQLKQHVVWKYEGEIENIPKNVKISKWLPQKDLLGHSKIRLFITHGGLLSLQESIYNAVPVIAVPLFAEQPGNVARVEEIHIGVKLDFHKMSGETVLEAITKVLGDKSYTENMKRYSSVFHDFIENQVTKGAYWVEYVVRHNGAHHLRSAGEQLNFFQYFLLDVIGLIVLIFSILFYLVFKLGKLTLHKFCHCNKSNKTKKNKKKQQ